MAPNSTVDLVATVAERARMRRSRQDSSTSVAAGAIRCRCGQSAGSLRAREVAYQATAFSLERQVHTSAYVINETICPACWTVVETRISVPEVEA